MNRVEVTDLQYITPIANVPSIMQHDILSHILANSLHMILSMAEIHERRSNA